MSKTKQTQKSQRERMYSEKDKIRLEKETYDSQIENIDARLEVLDNKKRMLDFKRETLSSLTFISAVSEKNNKNIQEIERINADILKLKQERYKLNNARKNAKDRMKMVSKKIKDDKKASGEDATTKVQNFFKKYRKAIVTFAGMLLVIFICSIILGIVNSTKETTERNRDYYITMDQDEYVFDCDIQETEYSLNCKKRKISGTFSEYDTVEFEYGSSYEVIGDHFSKEVQDYIYSSDYQTENFDIANVKRTQSRNTYIVLKNTFLGEDVFQKSVEIKYNLSDSDLEIIQKTHDGWLEKKRQEEAKKQEEAERKAQQEAEEKAKAEEEAKKEAESSSNVNNKPSIDTIADACWVYGRNHGVHLTDYASDEITQEGDYYRIMMFHDDGSYWRCWYNPSNNDTFVEKAYNSPWR
ncbi:hypothetical protein IJ798_01865 [Candidatus Saccharibacteria bacterium]|nr:hypothetical protein [Candidatus Saccharibacteria bacterium]